MAKKKTIATKCIDEAADSVARAEMTMHGEKYTPNYYIQRAIALALIAIATSLDK